MTWNFTNTFHLNKILLRPTFIEIALSVNDLLHFLCFSQLQPEDKLIIYRPAHNLTYYSDFHETFTDDLFHQSLQVCKVSNHSDI